jgi:hypothetical protein
MNADSERLASAFRPAFRIRFPELIYPAPTKDSRLEDCGDECSRVCVRM